MADHRASDAARHDAWASGDDYDAYMGRWSREVAPRFVAAIGAPPGAAWLDIGCGPGSLAAAVLDGAAPARVLGIDPSPGFVAAARRTVPDPRVEFRLGDAATIDLLGATPDVIASLLVLNFVPDPGAALALMRTTVQPRGRVAFAVWDYAGGGVGFLRAFWEAAAGLDPSAASLTERRRFGWCTADALTGLARDAGLERVDCAPITVPTVFQDLEDLWRPFTRGTGPAPGYCSTLTEDRRALLRERLASTLPVESDGSIHLEARAWAVTSRAPA